MPVEADLVTYLDTQLSETAGTNLFEGPMPELPAACMAITHYGGEAAEDRIMGPSLTPPGIEVPHVQVMTRSSAKATARTRAFAAHAVLDGFAGTLSGRAYFNIESIDGEPYCLGQDDNHLWQYVCNYRVEKVRG